MAVASKALIHIKRILQSVNHNRYFTVNGKLKRANVIDDLNNYNSELISAILADKLLHDTYVKEINGTKIFELDKFVDMLRFKNYWEDSYTKFNNKIGLTVGDRYIDDDSDVVLDFPYKDCVLKAGMTKEDVEHSEDANEPFLNETLAKPEIDELFEPKILVNATKYDQNGSHSINSFSDNDNLIIKGNNLIALHSIEQRYAGKIKMIYIDPPYNTGTDSFVYNDRFNHSTWLTFMKNRLEIAHELLSQNGSIFIEVDSNEDAYLKILMDDIFGRENFRNQINWKRRGGSANPAKQLNNVVEYILWYAKDAKCIDYTPVFTKNNEHTQKYIKKRFHNVDESGRRYMTSPIQSPNYRSNLIYNYKGYKTPKKGYSVSKKVLEKWDKEGRLAFPDSKDKNINRKIFLDEYKGQPINSLWDDVFVINPMSKERISDFSSGQKPEQLIERILKMVTHKGDLVLDFFMGSGTTQATALKMHRHFIGIEQMDYIKSISVPRLQKVIAGEQGGISKDVDWQGGGSFVYAELMPKNQVYLKHIEQAKNMDELMSIYEEMKRNDDIDFRVDLDKLEQAFNAGQFPALADRKAELIRIIDKNQLYYSYNNIEDADIKSKISDSDYKFNKSFYEDGDN